MDVAAMANAVEQLASSLSKFRPESWPHLTSKL